MKSICKHLFVGLLLSLTTALQGQEIQHMIGQTAPAFTLTDLGGKSFSLADSKGKFVVIHIATTWCPFCNAEAPNLEKLYKEYSNKGVDVFIIDVREDKELVEKSFSRFNFSFPVLLDLNGSVSASYAPEGVQPDIQRYEVPIASNLIIDKAGKIVFYSLLNTTAFDAKLTKLTEKLNELIENQ